MAKTTTFGALADKIESAVVEFKARRPEALLTAGAAIQLDAMARIGHYQEGWAELKPATQAERERLGYTPNDPLLRSGMLREAIKTRVIDAEAVAIGVDEGDLGAAAFAQEFGNGLKGVPPRPFIGPAGKSALPKAGSIIGKALEAALED